MLESIKCSTGGAYYVRGAWVNADADAPAVVAVLPLPGYSFSDGHSFFKVQLIDELP